jgi:formate C-acetyltransferase
MKDLEKIVGLQTDKPLKRAFMPYGGIKMAEEAAENYGYQVNPSSTRFSRVPQDTQPGGVSTPTPRDARGAPQPYRDGPSGHLRKRPYRRRLPKGGALRHRSSDCEEAGRIWRTAATDVMTDDVIRQREELAEQIRALRGMKEMAKDLRL